MPLVLLSRTSQQLTTNSSAKVVQNKAELRFTILSFVRSPGLKNLLIEKQKDLVG
jgi:hypothetical protein